MRIALVIAAAMVCSTASFAEGDVFAVLPTEATGDAGPEAQIATSMMTRALQRESLMLASADDVSRAVAANEAACTQSLIACARLVGAKVKATKVIVSSLWATADGTWELHLTAVDLASGAEPAPMQTFVTAERSEIGAIAEREALAVIGRGASGWLSVTLQGADQGSLLVDGRVIDALPLAADKRILAGRRAVEVRAPGLTPWQGHVDVATGAVATVALHVVGTDIVAVDTAASTGGPDGLVIAGIVGAGVGVAGIALGVFADIQQAAAQERFVKDRRQADNAAIDTWQTVAFASSTAGAVLVGAGIATIVIGMVTE